MLYRFKVLSFHQPQDIVDAHDALWLRVAAAVDDSALSLYPHKTPMLGQHPVLSTHSLPFCAYCRTQKIIIFDDQTRALSYKLLNISLI